MELFDDEMLMDMGNALGRAVKIDSTTMAASRGRFAKMCVEIDLSKPLIPSLTILGQPQRVEYEGLHLIYFECGAYDHRAEMCDKTLSQHIPQQSTTTSTEPTVLEQPE